MTKTKQNDLEFTEENISLFISRFSTGHWASQGELNAKKRSTPYIPGDKSELTPTLVKSHLETKMTLASYALTRNNKARFLVIDFDIETAIAQENMREHGVSKAYEEADKKIREKILSTIAKMGEVLMINREQLLLEKSGSKGYHLWMFFSEEMPSMDIHRFRSVLFKELDLEGYEIYPEQEAIDDLHSGSLIKLPLGVNRKTFVRCFFLDDTFQNDPRGQWKALEEVKAVTPAQVKSILKLQNTEAECIEDGDLKDLSSIGSVDKMMQECEALVELAKRASLANPDDGSINYTHDERLFLASLLGRFGVVGNSRIHDLLKNTDNYDVDKTQKYLDAMSIKPMTCASAFERGICKYKDKCEKIKFCHGKSPIKLAGASLYKKGRGDKYLKINTLGEIENPILCEKQVRVDFTVNSLIDSPYYAPKKVFFKECSKDTCNKFDACLCDIKEDKKMIEIANTDKLLIQVYGADDNKTLNYVKNKVYGCCSRNRLILDNIAEQHVVQPFSVSSVTQSLIEAEKAEDKENSDGADHAYVAKETKDYLAFCIGSDLETSKLYRGRGIILPNPQNQSVTVLFDGVEPLNSQVDGFTITDENRDLFNQFRNMTLEEKLADFSNNITFIKGRDEVTLAILFTFFSATEFEFNRTKMAKGWLDTILIGDSGQAKSILTERLIAYSGLGYINSSNSSAAGLIGGIDKSMNKSYINWGSFPRANKNLLFMDEIQNLTPEVHAQLRTVRYSGVAKVDKVIKGTHEAKVRLIAAANPLPKDKTMSEFKYGAMSLESLPMGAPDIRRFDLACFLNANDNNKNAINSLNEGKDPVITREMLRTAILWAWSRKSENIQISIKVTDAILKSATYISDKFDVTNIPICNTADMREKLARLTVAIAAFNGRTDDYVNLVPTVDDVSYATGFLDAIYSHKSVKLDQLRADRKRATDLDDNQYKEIMSYINNDEYAKMLRVMDGFMEITDSIRASDLGGWAGASSTDMMKIVTVLNKFNLISMDGNGAYMAKPKLTKFLNRYAEEREKNNENIF